MELVNLGDTEARIFQTERRAGARLRGRKVVQYTLQHQEAIVST